MANRACINHAFSAEPRDHQARDRARQGQVHRLLQNRKADAAGGMDSFPSNGATNEGGSGRRGRGKADRKRSLVLQGRLAEDEAVLLLLRARRCGGGRLLRGLVEVWKRELRLHLPGWGRCGGRRRMRRGLLLELRKVGLPLGWGRLCGRRLPWGGGRRLLRGGLLGSGRRIFCGGLLRGNGAPDASSNLGNVNDGSPAFGPAGAATTSAPALAFATATAAAAGSESSSAPPTAAQSPP